MSIRRVTLLLFFVLAACAPFAVWAQKPSCTTGTILTSSGPVCGITLNVTIEGPGTFSASAYLGIPYAVPPTGSLRWQYSKPFPQSAETLQATALADECPQSITSPTASASSSQCTDGKVLGPGQSEDCLYLNIWVPHGTTTSSQRPVMVFIHGGAFVTGSGGSPEGNLSDGTYLAATGNVIVVTFNYRLGVLGFLTHEGNYNFGFADQLLALRWVRTNIASFGGNPNNVTLFGESAGAMSVGLHALSSPKSAGLFQAALMESNPLGLSYQSISQAQTLSSGFCAGSPSLCTVATSPCDLVEAQKEFMAKQAGAFPTLPEMLIWSPAVDNLYITRQPMAAADSLGVPLILGTNRDEGTSFVYLPQNPQANPRFDPPGSHEYAAILDRLFGSSNAKKIRRFERYRCLLSSDCSGQLANVINDSMFTCANRRLAIQATQAANPQPLYLYQFTQVSSFNFWSSPPLPTGLNVPQCVGLVCHADELPYVFNTAKQIGQTFNPTEGALAQRIGGYWTNFAKSHSPGSAWPLFTPNKTYLMLNQKSLTANDPLNDFANCTSLWDRIGYPGSPTSNGFKKKPAH
jgi:carboxylesterase type B